MAIVSDIDIDRERSVTLTFDDGRICEFALVDLRAACPCASCRSWRDRGEQAWPRPGQSTELTVVDAELVGAWGLSLNWSDGHATGIYSWDALRRWCDGATDGLVVDAPDLFER
jgi:DUF971 family protein